MVKFLTQEHRKLSNQARFIMEVIDGTIVIAKRKKVDFFFFFFFQLDP